MREWLLCVGVSLGMRPIAAGVSLGGEHVGSNCVGVSMNNEKTIEVLRAAKKLIQQGWTKKKFTRVVDGQRCYCALGAVREIARYRYYCASQALRDALPAGWSRSVASYNDAPQTEKRHVLALFDKAILIARGVMKPGDTRRPDR